MSHNNRTILVSVALCFGLFLSGLGVPCPSAANDPLSRNEYANELMLRGEYDKALEHLQEANRHYPYDEVIKRNLANGYVLVGQKWLGKGQIVESAVMFQRATELYPDNGDFRLYHAIALAAQKKYDYATVELERARSSNGDIRAYLYHLGRVKYDTGNLEEAVALWEQALTMTPGDASLLSLVEKTRRELQVEDRMARGYSGRFTLAYDVAAKRSFAEDILQVLEDAYNQVGSKLEHYPEARTQVLVYTRKSFKDLVKGPEWSGGVFDGKIRLPIGGLTEITPSVRSVLFHEYAHVVLFELTRGNIPTWLNEGIAEYFGRQDREEETVALKLARQHGQLHSISRLEQPFTGLSMREATIAYDQSFGFFSHLVNAYGWHKVNDLLRALGRGLKLEAAVAEAFSDYMLTYSDIVQEWQKAPHQE